MDTILLSNMINHIIHISNYLIKQLKNINILLITFSWSFSYIFINFDQFYKYFFPKYPSIYLRYILYIGKIEVPIYPWLRIFSSLPSIWVPSRDWQHHKLWQQRCRPYVRKNTALTLKTIAQVASFFTFSETPPPFSALPKTLHFTKALSS